MKTEREEGKAPADQSVAHNNTYKITNLTKRYRNGNLRKSQTQCWRISDQKSLFTWEMKGKNKERGKKWALALN